MDKVYLLLRNNQENGPFTFDELLQQKLKPFDLIWVEGKSQSWAYPSELDELQASFQGPELVTDKANPAPSPSITIPETKYEEVSSRQITEEKKAPARPLSSARELERRAEEVRQRALSYKPANFSPDAAIETNTDETYFNYKRDIPVFYRTKSRKKHVSASQLVVVGIITVIVAGVLYGNWSLINPKPDVTSSAVTSYTEENVVAAKTRNETPSEAVMPVVEQGVTALPIPVNANTNKKLFASNTPAPTASETTTAVTEPQPALLVEETAPQEVVPAPVVVKAEKEEVAPKEELNGTEATETEKKKKGFLKGLFKKKKKDDTATAQVD